MPATDFQAILDSPVEAYEEGLRFFRGVGVMNGTLRKLVADLEANGIAYNIVGAVALNQHGYHRFTEDIDVLLTRDGLETFRNRLVGRGYRPAFEGASSKFRTTDGNVPVEVIVTGGYPGDGRPKAVQFHDPSDPGTYSVIDGVKTVTLEKLVELKLASGMTAPSRLRDLADVQELIRVAKLDATFADNLNESVRDKYLELVKSLDDQSGEMI